MINAIGEAIVQQTTRASLSSAVNDREVAVQKEMQARQKRPVEKTDESRSLGRQPSEEEKTGKILLEKYDRRGKLVKKIPPGYVPLSEIA